jgi:transcriptional activator HAC1
MDATMAAMRLASEQQLTPDCLAGAGMCDRRDGANSPSLESLMTLLWATHVFEKNQRWAPELDTAMEVRPIGELGDLFRPREMTGKGVIFGSSGKGQSSKKSLDDWCPAFKHNRP